MSEKSAFPSDTADKVLVRMPEGMRDDLKNAAKANNRTMNAEIVARLQASFDPAAASGASEADLTQTVRELESLQRLASLTYLLQRATFKADAARVQVIHAWRALQEAIESGTPEERTQAKAAHTALSEEMKHYLAEVEAIEKQMSLVHQERKFSGLKELRDVRPVYASVRGVWTDTGVVRDGGGNIKKQKKTP